MNARSPSIIARFLPARLGLLALVLPLVGGCGGENGQAQSTAAGAEAPPSPADTAASQDVVDLTAVGVDEGSVMTALIAVIDFSDFGCIHCASFHTNDYPVLQEEFVDGGDVLWKYIPISVGGFPNGDLAGTAGICVDEVGAAGAFAEMRDRLFLDREAWLTATPTDARDLFVSYAEALGIDADAFEACLDDDAAMERLERNNDMARRIGVTGTPTFIVQGNPVRGAPPLPSFQDALRRLVAEARAAADADGGASTGDEPSDAPGDEDPNAPTDGAPDA